MKVNPVHTQIDEFLAARKPAISRNLVVEVLHLVQTAQAAEPPMPERAKPRLQAAVATLKTSAILRASDTEFLHKP